MGGVPPIWVTWNITGLGRSPAWRNAAVFVSPQSSFRTGAGPWAWRPPGL